MPGRAPAQGGQPRQPFGPQLKAALVQAAPLFSAMAAGYSSGRGPYAYLDQGIAGMQAMQKQKRDEEAAAAAAAAFGGLVPGGMGPAGVSTKGGAPGNGAPGGYYGASADPGYVLGVDALPQSPTTPGGYSMGTEVKSYIPDAVKNGIFAGESGGDYNALFGFSNRDGGQFSNVKLGDMTVDQALAFSDPSGPYGQWVKGQIGRVATPMGAYQIVGTTLRAAKEGLGLTGNERMTPELQDQLGGWIYANQGTGAWEGYRGPQAAPEGGWGGGDVTMSAKDGGGLAMGGPMDPMADPYVQQLMTVMAMPGLTPEQQAVVQLQLQSRIDLLSKPQPGAEEEAARARRARDADLLGYQRGSPEWTQYVVTGEMPKAATPTDDMREYELAKTQGYTGTFQQYQVDLKKAGAASTTVNNNMGDGAPDLGKLSTDYGYVLDPNTGLPKIDPNTGLPTAAPVPGSPAAVEAEAAKSKAAAADSNALTATEVVTSAASRARMANKDRAVGGFLGGIAALNPSSPNAEVYRQVDVLKSNASIENLTAMRAASPTGGALGSITDKENKMLADKAGALDPASPYFERDLDDYERTLLRIVHGKEAGDAIFEATREGDSTAESTDADGWTTLPNGVKVRVKQ